MLATLISNMMRDKSAPPATIAEFMPGDAPDPEDPWDALERIAVANGEHLNIDGVTRRGDGEVHQRSEKEPQAGK